MHEKHGYLQKILRERYWYSKESVTDR